MTTLRKISEQIHRILEGGDITTDTPYDIREIQELVAQTVNSLLKAEYVDLHIRQREHIPPHALIAVYEGVEVQGATGSNIMRCSLLGPDLYEEWRTPGGDTWTTPGGDPWITGFDSSVTVNVTEVTGTGKYTYTIVIGDMAIPGATDLVALQAEIDACIATESSYIKFVQFGDGFPAVFSTSGITAMTVDASSVTITYDPSLTLGDPKPIQTATAETHALLADGTVNYGTTTLDKMQCCTMAVDFAASNAYLTLPAQPINLPRGMGVWRIYLTPDSPYIPMPSQVLGIAGATTHTGLSTILSGRTAYEYSSRNKIRFNKTLAEMPEKVTVELLVVDPATLSDTDMLPVPPEMEHDVIRTVLETLGAKIQEDLVPDGNPTSR